MLAGDLGPDRPRIGQLALEWNSFAWKRRGLQHEPLGQPRAYVLRFTYRAADDRVWAMHAPAEAVARGGAKHLISLRVVEILQIEPWLFFAKRRCRQRALAVSLEGSEVMFQPGHERDTLDRAGRRQCIE